MNFKIKLSAPRVFGICAVALCTVLAITLFILQDETFFTVLFPFLTYAIFSLAMGGTIPSIVKVVLVMGLGIIAQLLMYFAIGSVIGIIYQKVKNKYLKASIIIFALLILPAAMAKIYYDEQQWYNQTFHVGLTFQDCDKEKSPYDIANCYGDVYEKFPPSIEACEKMTESDNDYYRCASYVGEKSGNVDLCKKLSDPEGVDSCIASIPRFSKNDSSCNQIRNERNRDFCFYNAGIASNEARYCEKITNNYPSPTSTNTDCIFTIAMNNVFSCLENNEKGSCMKSACSALDNDEKAQSNCYLNVASQLNDESFCDFIATTSNQQRCRSYLKQYPSDIGKKVTIHVF